MSITTISEQIVNHFKTSNTYNYNGKYYTVNIAKSDKDITATAYILGDKLVNNARSYSQDTILNDVIIILSGVFDEIEQFGAKIVKLYDDIKKVNKL